MLAPQQFPLDKASRVHRLFGAGPTTRIPAKQVFDDGTPWPDQQQALQQALSRSSTLKGMSRLAVLLFMLFAMFWQSLALARAGSTVNALADGQHTALHWLEESHHHHDDGTYHSDDSNESVHHTVSDHLNAAVALLASSSHDIPLLGSSAPGTQHGASVSNPSLEGLLRPPRSRS